MLIDEMNFVSRKDKAARWAGFPTCSDCRSLNSSRIYATPKNRDEHLARPLYFQAGKMPTPQESSFDSATPNKFYNAVNNLI
ncbi:MAG: hypothetical protein AB3A66_19130 [Nodularia sp. CChRGM 3473]